MPKNDIEWINGHNQENEKLTEQELMIIDPRLFISILIIISIVLITIQALFS